MMTKEAERELIEGAINALQYSYSPYSGFRVGVALLGANGKIYTGVNVENASYGAGICAERTAAVKAVSDGETGFQAIAIAGQKPGDPDAEPTYAYPCGICRQFLNEFSKDDMDVIIAKTAEEYVVKKLSDLLPNSFGPADLGL